MRKGVKIAGSICGLAVAAGGAYKFDVIADLWLHEPTPQEVMIGEGILRAYSNPVPVRCLESEPGEDVIGDRLAPFSQGSPDQRYQAAALPRPLPKIIWLDQDICDGLELFAERDDKSVVSPFEIASLRAVAHEMSHIDWTYDEGRAECEAVQNGHRLPLAWGASEAEARRIGQRIADLAVQSKETLPDSYTINLEKCQDGGDWDLDPSQPGTFPRYQKESQ